MFGKSKGRSWRDRVLFQSPFHWRKRWPPSPLTRSWQHRKTFERLSRISALWLPSPILLVSGRFRILMLNVGGPYLNYRGTYVWAVSVSGKTANNLLWERLRQGSLDPTLPSSSVMKTQKRKSGRRTEFFDQGQQNSTTFNGGSFNLILITKITMDLFSGFPVISLHWCCRIVGMGDIDAVVLLGWLTLMLSYCWDGWRWCCRIVGWIAHCPKLWAQDGFKGYTGPRN